MSKILMLQVCASIGALLGVAFLYVGLKENADALATAAFAVFAVSLLVTPMLRLLPARAPTDAD